MQRRAFLAAAGAVVAAGCTRSGDGGGSGTTTTTRTRPSVASSSFAVEDVSCGTKSASASVSWSDVAVSVDGVLSVPSPCHTGVLDEVSYDADADELVVRVASTKAKETCVQCLADVSYTASVEFADGLPGRVRVEHRSKGGTRTVTTVSKPE